LSKAGIVGKSVLFKHLNLLAKQSTFEPKINKIQKAIQNSTHLIEKLIVGKKTDTLDYLKACKIVKKIYENFDLNQNENLDKDELKLLIDAI